ncbi:MAG: NifB/NifX family molybdenum-iron cluster-binding protein [Spirochaetes bacterium]|nr:NifB/NifX family molybdenum-iron cluster-binding protein [Spirochaetota bacterium]
MKIALPSNQSRVDEHFGHCPYFTIFTVNENNKIIAEDKVNSAAGCGCKTNIVETLSQMGVDLMLAGNMGEGAVNVLNNWGIKVLRGCSGDVKAVAEDYLAGKLQDSGVGCSEHADGCN